MAVPTGKKQVNFSATAELWEAFKAKAYEQGLDGSALLNQLMQDYLGGDIGISLPAPPESRELAALADKILARFDDWEERIDKAGSNLPDLLRLRDAALRDWHSDPMKLDRVRKTEFLHIIDFFIGRLEAAVGAGEGSYIQRLKADLERVTALYKAEQKKSARIVERLKALGKEVE